MIPNLTAEPIRAQLDLLRDRSDAPLPEVFRRVCEVAADTTRVERVGIWLLLNEDRTLRCVSLFERSKRRHSKGSCLSLADFPAFRRAVLTASPFPCELARADSRTVELGDTYLTPFGITSVLGAPIHRDGRTVGLITHEHVGPPRDWPDPDRAFALEVAEFVAERMKAAEGVLRTGPQPPAFARPQPPGNAAHDLRNVLAEIVAHAELLGMLPQLPPGAATRLAGITAAAERGVAVIRRLLEAGPAVSSGNGEHGGRSPGRAAPPPPAVDDGTGEYESLPPASTG